MRQRHGDIDSEDYNIFDTSHSLPIPDNYKKYNKNIRSKEQLLASIFSNLDGQDIANLSQVCKQFLEIIQTLPNSILLERFSKDILTKRQLLDLVQYTDFNDLYHSPTSIPVSIKNKKRLNELSPFKLNRFFTRKRELAQESIKIEEADKLLRSQTFKKVVTISTSLTLPVILGYLSGSYIWLFIGNVVAITSSGYGLYKGMSADIEHLDRQIHNTTALFRLFKNDSMTLEYVNREKMENIIKRKHP